MRKKAIVTGASRGIGRGIIRELAAAGYDIAFSYRTREDEAKEAAEEACRKAAEEAAELKAKAEAEKEANEDAREKAIADKQNEEEQLSL